MTLSYYERDEDMPWRNGHWEMRKATETNAISPSFREMAASEAIGIPHAIRVRRSLQDTELSQVGACGDVHTVSPITSAQINYVYGVHTGSGRPKRASHLPSALRRDRARTRRDRRNEPWIENPSRGTTTPCVTVEIQG